jgi:hypothetical protein
MKIGNHVCNDNYEPFMYNCAQRLEIIWILLLYKSLYSHILVIKNT